MGRPHYLWVFLFEPGMLVPNFVNCKMFARRLYYCFWMTAFLFLRVMSNAANIDSATSKHVRLIKTEKLSSKNNVQFLPQLINGNYAFETQNTNGYNLKLGNSTSWLKITIQNTDTVEHTAIVELTNPFLYLVKFFTVDSLTVVDSAVTGALFPYYQRRLRHPNFQYNISIAPQKIVQCYIQIQPGTVSGDFTVLVWEKEERSEYQLNETRYLSYFFIINVVFLLIIGIAIWQTRQQYHWYYFLYALFGFFIIYTDLGLSFRSVWPDETQFQRASLFIIANIYLVFGLLFVSRYFDTKSRMKILHPALQVLGIAGIFFEVVVFILLLMGRILPLWFVYSNTVVFILSGLIVLFVSASALRFKKLRNDAILLMIGFAPHALSILFLSVRPLGWFNTSRESWLAKIAPIYIHTTHTPNLLFWATLWEVIIVFYLILKRVKTIYEANNQMMVELSSQKEKSMRLLLADVEKERQRIAQELHDGSGVGLSSLKMKLKLLKEKDIISDGSQITELMGNVDRLYEDMRGISHNLMPKTLSKLGLYPAIDELVSHFKIAAPQITFNYYRKAQENNYNESAVVNIYRIVQELLTNVIKHSKAKEVSFQLIRHPDTLMISVEDDGAGFDIRQQKSGIGFEGIRSRVTLLNGVFSVDSAPQNGTFISISLPIASLQ